LQDYLVLFFDASAVLSVHSIFRKVRNYFISNGFNRSIDSFEEETGGARASCMVMSPAEGILYEHLEGSLKSKFVLV
jgi:hypothetical protein